MWHGTETSSGPFGEIHGVVKGKQFVHHKHFAALEYCCVSDIVISDTRKRYADDVERYALLFPSAAQ